MRTCESEAEYRREAERGFASPPPRALWSFRQRVSEQGSARAPADTGGNVLVVVQPEEQSVVNGNAIGSDSNAGDVEMERDGSEHAGAETDASPTLVRARYHTRRPPRICMHLCYHAHSVCDLVQK